MVLTNTATSVIVTVTNVGALLGRPTLYFNRASAVSGTLYWSTNFPDYHLEYTTTLAATNWTASELPVIITGTNYVISNTFSDTSQFYRLNHLSAP